MAKWQEGYCTEEEYDHEYRHTELQSNFQQQGLQVYIKVQSIELTLERPWYEGRDWAPKGLLNEHIVASSICFFDIENMADRGASVSFCVEVEVPRDDISVPAGSEGHRRMVTMYTMEDMVNSRVPH